MKPMTAKLAPVSFTSLGVLLSFFLCGCSNSDRAEWAAGGTVAGRRSGSSLDATHRRLLASSQPCGPHMGTGGRASCITVRRRRIVVGGTIPSRCRVAVKLSEIPTAPGARGDSSEWSGFEPKLHGKTGSEWRRQDLAGSMRIAFVSYDFGEYSIRHANALKHCG
jgi:hypothetical protein